MGETDAALESAWRRFRLEDGLALGAAVGGSGLIVTIVSFFDGVADPLLGLLGLTLVAIALQGVSGAFFLSILGLSEHAVLSRRGAP
jgi:hypothetical protein